MSTYRIKPPDGLGRSEVHTAVGDTLLGEVRRCGAGDWQFRDAHYARWGDVPGRPDGWTGQYRTRAEAAQACGELACGVAAERIRDEMVSLGVDPDRSPEWGEGLRQGQVDGGDTMTTPKLSETQRTALVDAVNGTGKVVGSDRTIAVLVRLKLAEDPHYAYGSGRKAWARITDRGREAVEAVSQP